MSVKHVLFVCVGNACRSQMAEAFARTYGSDVMQPESSGLQAAMLVPHETIETMAEKNIDISAQFPKPFDKNPRVDFDVVVNLSGYPIPGCPQALVWKVEDPIGGSDDEYRAVRDQIEQLVMKLILDLRRNNS
jgi:arsenate reductase